MLTGRALVLRKLAAIETRRRQIAEVVLARWEITGNPADRIRRRAVMTAVCKALPQLNLRSNDARDCKEVQRLVTRLGKAAGLDVRSIRPYNRCLYTGMRER